MFILCRKIRKCFSSGDLGLCCHWISSACGWWPEKDKMESSINEWDTTLHIFFFNFLIYMRAHTPTIGMVWCVMVAARVFENKCTNIYVCIPMPLPRPKDHSKRIYTKVRGLTQHGCTIRHRLVRGTGRNRLG